MNSRHMRTGGEAAPTEFVDRPGCRRRDRMLCEDARGGVGHGLRAASDMESGSLRLAAGLSWSPVGSRDGREGSGCDR